MDAVQPGDRVAVTGIYRPVPMRVSPVVRNIRSVYKTHIDVVHFCRTNTTRLHDSGRRGGEEKTTFEPERITLIEVVTSYFRR